MNIHLPAILMFTRGTKKQRNPTGRVAELPGVGAGAPTFQRPGGMWRSQLAGVSQGNLGENLAWKGGYQALTYLIHLNSS